jgi:hypothetical protein
LLQTETVPDQTRYLCIVSRDQLYGRDFLEAVQASVRPEDHLEVIVDRRRGEPSSQWHGAEDRRKRRHVDLVLQATGIAIVPAAVPGAERKPEPSPRDQTSGPLFEDRLVGREIPQTESPARAERSPFAQRVPSRLDSRVATAAPEDDQAERDEDHDDDDAERFEAIRRYKRERSRRLRLRWTLAALAVAAAVVIVLSPLAQSLKQGVAPRASSQAPPRATNPTAGGEPSSLSSRDDASAASPRDKRELSAESAAPRAPQTATGTTAGRRARSSANESSVDEPAPKLAASAPPRSESMRRLTSPRFPDLPRVDVSREPGSPTGIYSARIVDPAGRPLGDADVLLLARMSDGTVENVRMEYVPDRGTYLGALPRTRSSPVDLRVRVITGDKRLEIPVGP